MTTNKQLIERLSAYASGAELAHMDATIVRQAAQAISTLAAALDDAIVTLSAVRCVSLSPDWQDSGPHFHGVIGETLQRIATLTKAEGTER